MMKTLFIALHADKNLFLMKMKFLIILYFIAMEWVFLIQILNILILIIILMKITLILLFLSGSWPGIVNLKNAKHLKNLSGELLSIAWHPKRWWKFYISEDEKIEIKPISMKEL